MQNEIIVEQYFFYRLLSAEYETSLTSKTVKQSTSLNEKRSNGNKDPAMV